MQGYALTFSLLLYFSLCPSPCPSSAMAMEKVVFFYFNPDSVQSNFSLLTKKKEHFLTKQGYHFRFQAFSQQSDFDLLVAT